jgi:hypothetical protein
VIPSQPCDGRRPLRKKNHRGRIIGEKNITDGGSI